jgi:hypothetical protein
LHRTLTGGARPSGSSPTSSRSTAPPPPSAAGRYRPGPSLPRHQNPVKERSDALLHFPSFNLAVTPLNLPPPLTPHKGHGR